MMTFIMIEIDNLDFCNKSGNIVFNCDLDPNSVKRSVFRSWSKRIVYPKISYYMYSCPSNIGVYLRMCTYSSTCQIVMLKVNFVYFSVFFYSYQTFNYKFILYIIVVNLVRNFNYYYSFSYNKVPGYFLRKFVLFNILQFLKSMMIVHLITIVLVRNHYIFKLITMESRTNCGFKHVFICHPIKLTLKYLLYCSAGIMENPELPDTSRYPPNLPPGYDSKLYPKGADELTEGENLAVQMTDISVARKWSEVNRLHSKKITNYQELRNQYEGTTRGRHTYCSTCSEVDNAEGYPEPTYHAHVSSLDYRLNISLDSFGQYLCLTCETTPHPFKAGMRYPVLVTSSTLAGWQGKRYINGYEGDPIHIDSIAMPGAKLRDLQHAMWAELGNLERPVDLVLCSGINDVLQGRTAHDILQDLQHIKDWFVNSIHLQDEPKELNTFAICTLIMPPCCTILPGDTHTVRVDRTEVLEEVNMGIIEMNNEGAATSKCPRFQTWGRSGKAGGSINQHRRSQWREANPRNQLHLNDPTRLRMGRAVVKYFVEMYKIEDQVRLAINNTDDGGDDDALDGQPALEDKLVMLKQTTEQAEPDNCLHIKSSLTQTDSPKPVSVVDQVEIDDHLLDAHDPLLDDHEGLSDVGDLCDKEILLDDERNV